MSYSGAGGGINMFINFDISFVYIYICIYNPQPYMYVDCKRRPCCLCSATHLISGGIPALGALSSRLGFRG